MKKTTLEDLKQYFDKNFKETSKNQDPVKNYENIGITVKEFKQMFEDKKKTDKPFEQLTAEDFDAWDEMDQEQLNKQQETKKRNKLKQDNFGLLYASQESKVPLKRDYKKEAKEVLDYLNKEQNERS